MSYLKRFGTRRVPQTAPIPGSGQARNSAGGYVWTVDDTERASAIAGQVTQAAARLKVKIAQ